MNVPTGEFRALTAEAEELRRDQAVLIRTLAAELAHRDGPLSRDRVARYLADAVLEQGRQLAQLRPVHVPRARHLHAVK